MKSTVQKVTLTRPVVADTERGALGLADPYWREIRRLTIGLVRARTARPGLELRLVGAVSLFRFGPPSASAGAGLTECRFAIVGGLLAKEEGGWLTFTQRTAPALELEVSVEDYVPRLSSTRRRGSFRRFAYRQVQERAHRAVGKRYLARMASGSR